MELCIKTVLAYFPHMEYTRFNPCFNGTMYKNQTIFFSSMENVPCFNPCFNGTMYKNGVDEEGNQFVFEAFQSLF